MAKDKKLPAFGTSQSSIKLIYCSGCGKEKDSGRNFYKSNNPVHRGFAPLCKECIKKRVYRSEDGKLDKLEVQGILKELDLPYIEQNYQTALNSESESFGVYIRLLNTYAKSKRKEFLCWTDSEFELPKLETNHESEVNNANYETMVKNAKFTDEEIQMKKDSIKLLGYDPFEGYSIFDRKFLYAELLPYLDEETLEDQYKISVIIQILNNNNQIRKIDLAINNLSSDSNLLIKNSGEVKSLSTIKKEMAQNNDKLSKENAIAIKHRGDKRAGKSTLGALMKDLRELGFEKAEEDYYDMKKAYGMRITADISNQSILSQLNLDEKDTDDMLKMQRELIQELQEENADIKEKLRQANEKIMQIVGDNNG